MNAVYSYGPEKLEEALAGLGLKAADTVLVHSGFSRFNGFTGTPEDVIAVLRSIVGNDGNLLMMSMPYGGSSQRYADSGKIFDVKKTPSSLGIISETFRRRDGVVRSANPLHPILAEGPMAKWLLSDHETLRYSCGRRSPFARFKNLNGKFLFFDAVFRSLTFVHFVEDYYKDKLPVPLCGADPVQLSIRMPNGSMSSSSQYLFSAQARERRNFGNIENTMIASGRLIRDKIGNTSLLYTTAKDVVATADELILNNAGFYT